MGMMYLSWQKVTRFWDDFGLSRLATPILNLKTLPREDETRFLWKNKQQALRREEVAYSERPKATRICVAPDGVFYVAADIGCSGCCVAGFDRRQARKRRRDDLARQP